MLRAAALVWIVLASALLVLGTPVSAEAQARRVEIRLTAARRTQLAIWIESADASRFETIRLTDAVAYRGIGNRPGALMMNSGRHWPYGRREGALPIWAHRRFEVEGDAFRRVIFDGRVSEGNASSAGSWGEPANTPDPWFCLSFNATNNDIELGEDAFDAMTCASVFSSNKGRYLTAADLASPEPYGEPWETSPGVGVSRPLSLTSLYPPRRDVSSCTSGACREHPDVAGYAADALAIMPTLDAVSMATPADGAEVLVVFDVPTDWPDGDYVVFVEANVEGDHAPGWDATAMPTPRTPTGDWDTWAMTYGYPYRGQPSVLYEVPVSVRADGAVAGAATPAGYGSIHGETGEIMPMDGTIMDDPATRPGSGADRLRRGPDGMRVRVTVPAWDVCLGPDAPIECGQECHATRPCTNPALVCGPDHTCIDMCELPMVVPAPTSLTLSAWGEAQHTHEWARMSFVVPEIARGVLGWEVRVGTAPITDEASFMVARQGRAASAEDAALVLPVTREDGTPLLAGDVISLELGGMSPETHYYVGVRAFDVCNARGQIATAELTTTAIQFTTVSPCFVATAAYGSPLDARIGVLRRFRDRVLLSNELGRALVAVYEAVGPTLADAIRDEPDARAAVQAVLDPVVGLLEALER